jgi:hypothetical protein
VSDPVAPPPPPAGEGFPPPANEGFGGAPAAGQPYGAAPAPGQPYGASPAPGQPYGAAPAPGQPLPGQPYGDQAQQGFGGPAQQGFGAPAAFPAGPKKEGPVRKVIVRIVVAVAVLFVVLIGRNFVFGDKAKDAAVGDCIASSQDVKVDEQTEAKAKVVDCSSGDAAFTVVGRVEGESDTNSKSCEKFFKENEQYYVYGSVGGGGGYLLCLRPKG